MKRIDYFVWSNTKPNDQLFQNAQLVAKRTLVQQINVLFEQILALVQMEILKPSVGILCERMAQSVEFGILFQIYAILPTICTQKGRLLTVLRGQLDIGVLDRIVYLLDWQILEQRADRLKTGFAANHRLGVFGFLVVLLDEQRVNEQEQRKVSLQQERRKQVEKERQTKRFDLFGSCDAERALLLEHLAYFGEQNALHRRPIGVVNGLDEIEHLQGFEQASDRFGHWLVVFAQLSHRFP